MRDIISCPNGHSYFLNSCGEDVELKGVFEALMQDQGGKAGFGMRPRP